MAAKNIEVNIGIASMLLALSPFSDDFKKVILSNTCCKDCRGIRAMLPEKNKMIINTMKGPL